MAPSEMERLIRTTGAVAVADQVNHFFVIGVRDGLDFTRWRVTAGGGMLVFDYGGSAQETELSTEREALRRRMAELLPRSYHEATARQERDETQQRVNEIDHLLGTTTALGTVDLPRASILCVNAPEVERARFAAQLPAAGDPDYRPVTLLMREQAFVPAPF